MNRQQGNKKHTPKNVKRKIHIFILTFSGALILCSLGLLLFFATLNNERSQWLVLQAVDIFTDYKVKIEGDFTAQWSRDYSSIKATRIHIKEDSEPPSFTAELENLEIEFATFKSLFGDLFIRNLLIADTKVSIKNPADEELDKTRQKKKTADISMPVLGKVSLSNIQIFWPENEKSKGFKLVLKSFQLDDINDKGPLYVKSEGVLNSQSFTIDGQLGSLEELLKGEAPYPLDFKGALAGFAFTASGAIDQPTRGKGMNLNVTSEEAEFGNIRRLLGYDIPDLGSVRLKAVITGDLDKPVISSIDLKIAGNPQFELTARGSSPDPANGNDLHVHYTGSCSHQELLKRYLTEDYPKVSLIEVEGDLYYRQGDYFFENTKVYATDNNGLELTAFGSAKTDHKKPQQYFTDLEVSIKAKAHQWGDLKLLFEDTRLEQIGPVEGEARITGTSEALTLEKLIVFAGTKQKVHVECRGGIDKIPLSEARTTGIRIFTKVKAKTVQDFTSLFDITFPDIGPFEATFHVQDQEDTNYGINDIKITAGSRDSRFLSGTGAIKLIRDNGGVEFGGFEAEVEGSAPGLADIQITKDLKLPNLGALKFKASLNDQDGDFDVLDIKEITLEAGSQKEAFLEVNGKAQAVGRLGSDKRIFEATFKAASKPWMEKLIQKSKPDNHIIEGKVKVSGTTKMIHIEELTASTTGKKRVHLEANGTFKKTGDDTIIDVMLSSGASDVSILQSFLGKELPPLGSPSIEGNIKGSMEEAFFQGSVQLGKTMLETSVVHNFTEKPFKLTTTVSSPTVFMKDLGFHGDKSAVTASKVKSGSGVFLSGDNIISKSVDILKNLDIFSKQSEDTVSEKAYDGQTDEMLFSNEPLPFHNFKALDLSLRFDADQIIGPNYELQKLDFDLSLADGKLSIDPATFNYLGGFFDLDFIIDTAGTEPELTLKIAAEDADIGALLATLNYTPVILGQLNLVTDLRSRGNTFREIATALDGDIGVAIEKGKVKKVADIIGGDALDMISMVRSSEEYSELNCMMFQLFFEKGMGKSQAIYIDTPTLSATGIATFDLDAETMEITLQPEAKKGFAGTKSAAHIKGPITNPKIRKIPFREAGRLFGEISLPMVFLPVRAMGYLKYMVTKDKNGDTPCIELIPESEEKTP